MEPDEQLRELRDRIAGLSDEELLDIVEVDAADYREEAVEFAKAELSARGVEFDEEPAEDLAAAAEQESVPRVGTHRDLICSVCGGETRFGILFAGKELTVVFADNSEERFVEAYACTQCGRLQLLVDYETDVQSS